MIEDEVRIGDFICRASSNVELKNIKFKKHTGTAICTLELQKRGEKPVEIKVVFDFDFKIWYDEAPDENEEMHEFIDGFEVENIYRKSSISKEAKQIEESILKLNDAFMYRIGCALDDKYEC